MDTRTESFRMAVENWLKSSQTPFEQLARKTGCSPSTLYKFLNGETQNINLSRALAIAEIIGYDFNEV